MLLSQRCCDCSPVQPAKPQHKAKLYITCIMRCPSETLIFLDCRRFPALWWHARLSIQTRNKSVACAVKFRGASGRRLRSRKKLCSEGKHFNWTGAKRGAREWEVEWKGAHKISTHDVIWLYTEPPKLLWLTCANPDDIYVNGPLDPFWDGNKDGLFC